VVTVVVDVVNGKIARCAGKSYGHDILTINVELGVCVSSYVSINEYNGMGP